jgi:hypothetical protein
MTSFMQIFNVYIYIYKYIYIYIYIYCLYMMVMLNEPHVCNRSCFCCDYGQESCDFPALVPEASSEQHFQRLELHFGLQNAAREVPKAPWGLPKAPPDPPKGASEEHLKKSSSSAVSSSAAGVVKSVGASKISSSSAASSSAAGVVKSVGTWPSSALVVHTMFKKEKDVASTAKEILAPLLAQEPPGIAAEFPKWWASGLWRAKTCPHNDAYRIWLANQRT